jgi:hypothetical protein
VKGYIFDILFSHLRQAPQLSTIPQTPEPIFHAESIVLAKFNQASIAAYQAKDETNNTFNIYLIIAGIIAAGLPVLEGLFIQRDTPPDLKLLLSLTADLTLYIAGILSFFFLSRFLTLAQERFENIKIMNSIKVYYDKRLRHIVNLDEIFGKQQATEQSISVPAVIRYAVFIIGSLYIGGGIGTSFNAIAAILNLSFLNSSFLNSRLFTSDILSIALFVIASVIMFFIYRWYYNSHISRIERSTTSSK